MTDLKITIIYMLISQRKSAYTRTSKTVSYEVLLEKDRTKLDNNNSVKFNFPNAKDSSWNDLSTVYPKQTRYYRKNSQIISKNTTAESKRSG